MTTSKLDDSRSEYTPQRILREVMERCGASLSDEEREEYEDRMGAALVIVAVRAYGAASSGDSITLAEPGEPGT